MHVGLGLWDLLERMLFDSGQISRYSLSLLVQILYTLLKKKWMKRQFKSVI